MGVLSIVSQIYMQAVIYEEITLPAEVSRDTRIGKFGRCSLANGLRVWWCGRE